ncbi:MAG: PEP-CTERM sorting domain-containing protein [Phycisphaerae bacterium]
MSRFAVTVPIALALLAMVGLAGAGTSEGVLGDGNVSLLYNAGTGSLTVYSDGNALDALSIESAGSLMDPNLANLPSEIVDGHDGYVIKNASADIIGFIAFRHWDNPQVLVDTGWNLGPILPEGLDEATLLADMTIEYSLWDFYEGANLGDLLYGIPGDANLDGKVSLADLSALAGNWGSASVGFVEGDFNDDNNVSLADLSALAGNWGFGTETGTAMAPSAVPEPATLALLAVGCAGIVRRKR